MLIRIKVKILTEYIDRNTTVYFDSFVFEYIPQHVLNKTKINPSLRISLEYNVMIILLVYFIV